MPATAGMSGHREARRATYAQEAFDEVEMQRCEQDDAEHQYQQQKAGAAARVLNGIASDQRRSHLGAVFISVDRLVLGAMILEYPPNVGHPAEQHEISQEQRQPDKSPR